MDFEFEDVPLEIAGLFILVAFILQSLLWIPGVAPSNFGAISPFLLLTSLVLLAVGGWRLIMAVREKIFSNRDYFQRYVYARVDELEERVGNLERSLGKFQRLMLNHVDTLKSQISTKPPLSEEAPTKEQLEKLRVSLGLEGSLQHKGLSVYHVLYDKQAKKHRWTRLGKLKDLEQKIQGEKPLE